MTIGECQGKGNLANTTIISWLLLIYILKTRFLHNCALFTEGESIITCKGTQLKPLSIPHIGN